MPAFRPVIDRFVEKFELNISTGCWEWTAAKSKKGYGQFQHHRHGRSFCTEAHLVSYEIFVGDVPRGMEIHHRCRNRGCVNPNHLEAIHHKANCDWAARKQDAERPTIARTYLLKIDEDKSWHEAYRAERERKRLAKNAKITGRPRVGVLERMAAQSLVNYETGCWEWRGFTDKRDWCLPYGRIKVPWTKTPQFVHRISFWHFTGDIPDGLVVDHMCSNARCWNPLHLRLLTVADNSCGGWVKIMRAKTHCKHGHPFNEMNTVVRHLKNGTKGRGCRACRLHGAAKTEFLIKLGLLDFKAQQASVTT